MTETRAARAASEPRPAAHAVAAAVAAAVHREPQHPRLPRDRLGQHLAVELPVLLQLRHVAAQRVGAAAPGLGERRGAGGGGCDRRVLACVRPCVRVWCVCVCVCVNVCARAHACVLLRTPRLASSVHTLPEPHCCGWLHDKLPNQQGRPHPGSADYKQPSRQAYDATSNASKGDPCNMQCLHRPP